MVDGAGGPDPTEQGASRAPASPGRLLGSATWFDGESSRRHAVTMHDGAGLVLVEEGRVVATLVFEDLRRQPGPERRLILHPVTSPPLARLEVTDVAAIAALAPLCPALAGPGAVREAGALRIVAWSMAAAASLVLAVLLLIPAIATRLVPFVPVSLENRLGSVADGQMRRVLSAGICSQPAGRAALDKLVGQLRRAGPDPGPLAVDVWDSAVPNAFALPGNRIRVFQGLLDAARSPDELAGVLAHEIGHVLHRDGLREFMRSSAQGYVLGLLLGDVAGAGVLIGAGGYVLDASFGRAAETEADTVALGRMDALGRPAKPLADLLGRITAGSEGAIPAFLNTHPATPERAARLAGRTDATGPALLDETEWQALRGICTK